MINVIMANKPSLAQYVVVVLIPDHPLPKHLEKFLRKFDPNKGDSVDDFI